MDATQPQNSSASVWATVVDGFQATYPLVEWRLSTTGGALAVARGEHDAASTLYEQQTEAARRAGLAGPAAQSLGYAAFEAMLAGDADSAKRLASDGLALAREAGMPSAIVRNLTALAGALADDDRAHAGELLRQAVELRVSLDYETFVDSTQALIVSACLEQWPQALGFAGPAIRLSHWTSNWMSLVGAVNVVARAVAPVDAESAAVLQGIAHNLSTDDRDRGVSAMPGSPLPPSGSTGVITKMRRTTTGLLIDALGEARMRELRAQGDAMDNDHAVAYALDATARALSMMRSADA